MKPCPIRDVSHQSNLAYETFVWSNVTRHPLVSVARPSSASFLAAVITTSVTPRSVRIRFSVVSTKMPRTNRTHSRVSHLKIESPRWNHYRLRRPWRRRATATRVISTNARRPLLHRSLEPGTAFHSSSGISQNASTLSPGTFDEPVMRRMMRRASNDHDERNGSRKASRIAADNLMTFAPHCES